MQILVFEHIVFSSWARPGRGLAASSSTSSRVDSKWFKYQKKSRAMLYSTVACDGWRLYSIVACYIVCYRTTKLCIAALLSPLYEMLPWRAPCCVKRGIRSCVHIGGRLCVWVWPLHDIAIANIVLCMAKTTGVGWGVVYCALDVR